MSYLKIIFLLFILSFGLVNNALADNAPLPVDEAFKLKVKAVSSDQLDFQWEIAPGYYLYQEHIKISSKVDAVAIAPLVFPVGEKKHDENFGDVIVFRHDLTLPASLVLSSPISSVKVLVQYRGCADKGICYPPQKKIIDLDLPASTATNHKGVLLEESISGFDKLKGNQDDLLSPESAFKFFAEIKNPNTLHVNWAIAKGYYLYREKILLEITNIEGVKIGEYSIPHGAVKEDEAFGKVEIFHDELAFDLPINRVNSQEQKITLVAKFQGCAERGVCYPPMTKVIDLLLPPLMASEAVTKDSSEQLSFSEQDQIANSFKNDGFGMTLISFLGFGVLISFTPCIFPMIPILSGIIVGHGHKITTMRGFLLSLSYVIASALTYTVFGVLAALFGGNLQTTFQQPWIVFIFSSVFVLLSFSMFGFYDLELPNSIKTKLSNSSFKHQDGSLLGAAIMGVFSTLIVGPCVAAPLAGALIFIGQTGDALLGGSALFAMGLGMGFPLLLLGASAGKLLPKAGAWLNATKAIFGVLMLAVAVWMLGRILPSAVITILWAMLLILPSVYLSALDPLPIGSSGWAKLAKGLGLVMFTYGVILLIGVSLGNTNPLQPLKGLVVGNSQAVEEEGLVFERVKSLGDLEEKIKQANLNHQPVMLDFYADWCVSCKEMEVYTFTDAKVKAALKGYMLLQADVTKDSDDDKLLLNKFNLIGPPAILFFDGGIEDQKYNRVIGYQEPKLFIENLKALK